MKIYEFPFEGGLVLVENEKQKQYVEKIFYRKEE